MLTTYDGPEVVAGPGSNVGGAHIYVDDVEVLWIGLSWCMVGRNGWDMNSIALTADER